MAQSTLDIIQAISKIISTKGHDGIIFDIA